MEFRFFDTARLAQLMIVFYKRKSYSKVENHFFKRSLSYAMQAVFFSLNLSHGDRYFIFTSPLLHRYFSIKRVLKPSQSFIRCD